MTTTAATSAKRICPACLSLVRVTDAGAIMRHGFNAKFPMGRDAGGFHTGACEGFRKQPVGTAAGNAFALNIAADCDRSADALDAKPAHSAADAEGSLIAKALEGMRKRGKLAKLSSDYTAADFAGTPYRGWFTAASLDGRAKSMDRTRAANIAGLRQHAAALREAVAANPARE
jgi:hypothetical protein